MELSLLKSSKFWFPKAASQESQPAPGQVVGSIDHSRTVALTSQQTTASLYMAYLPPNNSTHFTQGKLELFHRTHQDSPEVSSSEKKTCDDKTLILHSEKTHCLENIVYHFLLATGWLFLGVKFMHGN